ncbi:23S rRNA pseudouridine2457 synthase [Haloferula luteola]|uniref:Pseudouridine synthase n=1 Tax=Haloferula luteola TaxID=595692 RepID=A0A840V2R8_9BACT|nr:pseudouridine synthase [Haloferula luteola]MBB5352282.1 23S rRNA pseudouridine2457 synthase [Haloferula luteola]
MLLAFHKPFDVLSQFTPENPGQRTLAEFGFPRGVWPIGRLDRDSEGLLILSDEKPLVDRLLHPRSKQPKTYFAQVEGIPEPLALQRLTDGSLTIQGHRCAPAKAHLLDPQPDIAARVPPIRVRREIPDCWISLTLIEGKNRQVRRMTAAVGHPTLRLIRMAIGSLHLHNLPQGQWREITGDDRSRLLRGR